mmetsp:Transcript_68892/g.165362  ORF Transcript_68892/g.165362 Transcript_68892/m.165362 type:complete len:787 (-) Transcript_68892:72-2432(-)
MYVPIHQKAGRDLIEQDVTTGTKVYQEDFEVQAEDEAPDFLKHDGNLSRIATVEDKYSQKAAAVMKKLMGAQDGTVIPLETYERVIKGMQERQAGCLSLPFSLILFLVFSVSSFLHEDITNVFLVESGLRQEFSSGLSEVQGVSSVWSWMQSTLVPTVFIQEDILGRPLPPGDFNRVLMYNQLHGPLLMEQSRADEEPCTDSDGIASDMRCFPMDTESSATFGRDVNCTFSSTICEYYSSSFSPSQGRRLRQMRPEHMGKLPMAKSGSGNYQVMIFPTTEIATIREHIDYLYQKGWLDIYSKSLTIKALFLNAEVGRPRLEHLKVLFSFNRGGGVFYRLTLESLFLQPFSGSGSVMADALYVCMLVITVILEIANVVKALRRRAIGKHFRKGQTWLELSIIVFGFLCIVGYYYQHTLREEVQKALREVIDEDMSAISSGTLVRTDWRSYATIGSQLHDDTDAMISFSSYLRILVSEYHLLLMVRFFGAFRAQPRLGVVTDTLVTSITDIAHFMVVLIPTFMAFAVSGAFIFGRRLEEFSTFNGAIATCFKMAMEGEYDWPRLSEEHWWTAAFWVWTFMLLLVLLMLNMVLAIIMDVYTELRQNTAASVTVWQTVFGGFWRVYHARGWVSAKELVDSIRSFNEYFTKEELVQKFPTMPSSQMRMIERDCRYQNEVSSDTFDLNDSMKMCMSVKLSMDKVAEEIQLLVSGNPDEGADIDHSSVEQSWLKDVSNEMAVQNHMMLGLQWHLHHLQSQWQVIETLYGVDGKLDSVTPKVENSGDSKMQKVL